MAGTGTPPLLSAAFYEAHQEWAPATARAVALHLREAAPGIRSAAFLGCATGVNDALPFARLAPDVRVLASDVDPDFLRRLAELAGGQPNLVVRKVDITADLDSMEPADLVTLFFVIHRVSNWEGVVPNLVRRVAPGGSFFTSEFVGPGGAIYLSNENGGSAQDPVSRLIRRYAELRPEPFTPPLRSTRVKPFLDALGGGLARAGHRDFAWPQAVSVQDMFGKIETGAYAPYRGLRPPPPLLARLREEFSREWSERVDLIETIRVHQFRRV